MKKAYPSILRTGASYILHNKEIQDPYSWLEDPDSQDTVSFVDAQNKLFKDELSKSTEIIKNLRKALSKTFYPRTSAPYPHAGSYYYYHNTGLENQSKYLRAKSLSGEGEEVFFDPNLLSPDGTTAIRTSAWSRNDKYFAYALSERGSDWSSIRIRDTTAKELADNVNWVKFSPIAWLGDEGFFYVRYPALKEGKEKGAETDLSVDGSVYYHSIGNQDYEDVKVLSLPEKPRWLPSPSVSDCHKYLVVTITDGCEPKNLVWIAEIPSNYTGEKGKVELKFIKVINEWKGEYEFLGNDGEKFYFVTSCNAPKRKVVALTLTEGKETEVLAEQNMLLNSVDICKNKLILVFLEHVKHAMYVRDINGASNNSLGEKIELPIGTVSEIKCRRESSFVSFKITSFVLPGRSFTMNIDCIDKIDIYRDDEVKGLVPEDYSVSQVFVPVEDGKIKIPMFTIHHKDLDLSVPNPTILYGYGGFDISILPSFYPHRLVFMKHLRGICVIANIRGGGEYGKTWHDGGRRANKMNCFYDFIACAKYLNSQPYCDPSTLAIEGGSNGGLLVGACTNIAPEQFGAVIAHVGVLDMFKFHKFTIGHAWRSDYGDPDIKEDFEVLEKYSPLHNIVPSKTYPAILVVTADHDDRVVPLHSLKYIATLQQEVKNGGPFFARIEVSAGHGAGKPTSKIIEERADILTFIAKYTGAKWHN